MFDAYESKIAINEEKNESANFAGLLKTVFSGDITIKQTTEVGGSNPYLVTGLKIKGTEIEEHYTAVREGLFVSE